MVDLHESDQKTSFQIRQIGEAGTISKRFRNPIQMIPEAYGDALV